MGSVIDYEECYTCKGVMHVDYYYKTGEEYRCCQRCGTSRVQTRKRDEDKQPILDADGIFVYDVKNHEGYGVQFISAKDTPGGLFGSFSRPVTQEEIDSFRKEYDNNESLQDESFLTKWEEGELTLLVGKSIPDIHRLDFKMYLANH